MLLITYCLYSNTRQPTNPSSTFFHNETGVTDVNGSYVVTFRSYDLCTEGRNRTHIDGFGDRSPTIGGLLYKCLGLDAPNIYYLSLGIY